MNPTTVATANTNPTPGTVVNVSVDEIICILKIEKNKYDDELPMIPDDARVIDGKVLYQLKIRAELTYHSSGKKAADQMIQITSNRSGDVIKCDKKTDNSGVMTITLKTYNSGNLELDVVTPGITAPKFKINLKDAWYETPFLITGYHVCNEVDFSGPLVSGAGLDEQHKEDFLFSARGVPMQGTGMSTDGRYIALLYMRGQWQLNSRGRPDHVPSDVTRFHYVPGVKGQFGYVRANLSIAVDQTIIPRKSTVQIDGVGKRSAHDTGGKINLYHIDNFLGAGKTVVTEWLRGGVNGTRRKVKFLGE